MRHWIDDHVIRLGLCPYAAKPFTEEQIRYVVTGADDDATLVHEFFIEAALLLELPEEEVSTTFLIAPHYAHGIEAFYGLYEWLTDTLEEQEEVERPAEPPSLEGFVGNRVQPAFFHPEWSFSGMPDQSPVHFEKRSPYPVINLLRRAQLDSVVQAGLDRGVIVNEQIAAHNAAALEREGHDRLSAVFASKFLQPPWSETASWLDDGV